jgi:hypothetical protein
VAAQIKQSGYVPAGWVPCTRQDRTWTAGPEWGFFFSLHSTFFNGIKHSLKNGSCIHTAWAQPKRPEFVYWTLLPYTFVRSLEKCGQYLCSYMGPTVLTTGSCTFETAICFAILGPARRLSFTCIVLGMHAAG